MIEKLKTLPLQAYLFALYSIIFIYRTNLDEIRFNSIFFPLFMAFAVTTVVLIGANLMIRDPVKASFLTFILSIAFFTYGHVHLFFKPITPFSDLHFFSKLIMTGYLVCFLLLASSIIRTRIDLKKFCLPVTLTLAGLILFNTAMIGYQRIRVQKHLIPGISTSKPQNKAPDIYYIIFDSYPGKITLENFFSFDVDPFFRKLESTGFYIAKKSKCNYFFTDLSLASSLNMDHLVKMAEQYGQYYLSYQTLDDLIDYSAVHRILKSRGYKLINYNSGYGQTAKNDFADSNIAFARIPDNMTDHLVSTTLLRIFSSRILLLKLRFKLKSIPAILKDIAENAGKNGPKFVFAHLISPHPPDFFKPDGSAVTDLRKSYDIMYNPAWFIDEIGYLNSQITKLAEALIKDSDPKPIIIIQGDHGSRFQTDPDLAKRESAFILNGYYLPERCRAKLYDGISPVNSFRLVFNCLFGDNYPLLQDDIYWSEMRAPHNFRKITGALKNY